MPDISELNGTAIDNVAEFDGLTVSSAPPVVSAPTAAYSVRLLDSAVGVPTYTGAAMRVRRSGDDIEADVEFDSNNEISLTSSISNASSGTYTDLADFVDHATTPRDAFCVEWKDQSGNGNDATQPTAGGSGQQPQLYDATTGLITENGKPALQFNQKNLGANIALSEFHTSNSTSVSFVYTDTQSSSFKVAWGHSAITGGSLEYGYWTGRSNTNLVYEMQNSQTGFARPSGYQNAQHGVFLTNGGTQCEFYMDSALLGTKLNMTCTNSSGTFYLGTSGYNFPFSGFFQEFIVWPENNQSNQTTIEENINSNYLIYQPTDQPTSGLLYDYGSATGGTDAAAAYSVRQLSDKAILCMRIRRDMGAGNPGDDDEINIGFDSNGDLDTQAIADFCGTGTGYVTRWWDQSVNGNHADQPVGGTGSNTSQPQIYNGTAVIEENGNPAVDFSGAESLINSPIYSTSMSVFCVWKCDSSAISNDDGIYSFCSTDRFALQANRYAVNQITTRHTGATNLGGTTTTTNQNLTSHLRTGSTATLHANGTALTTTTSNANTNGGDSLIGKSGTAFLNGFIWEIVAWSGTTDGDQSSNRTGIETNIDTYYQIPGM